MFLAERKNSKDAKEQKRSLCELVVEKEQVIVKHDQIANKKHPTCLFALNKCAFYGKPVVSYINEVTMPTIAKISVEKFDSKEQTLFDFDKSAGLEENVASICHKLGLPKSDVYGVKYNPFASKMKNHYISESNFHEIKHGDCLKVVFSIKYIIRRIADNIRKQSPELRQIAFEDVARLSLDPIFIQELALSQEDKILVKVFVEDHLASEEQTGLLRTVVHLFSKGYIHDTSQNILDKTLKILRNSDATNEELRFALSLLHKILISSNAKFSKWKERIVREVAITELNPYTWRTSSRDLQYSALLLINTIIRICKGEKKTKLIREMNLRKTRENIYSNIIKEGSLDKSMEHELYVLQTHLLSLFSEALHSKISLDDNSLFSREEFELCSDDMRRITILMDFDEENIQNYVSVENLTFNYRDSKLSLASMRSDPSSRVSRHVSENETDNTISHLTLEALRHYKKLHFSNFHQSQIEEQLYEPGIFVTSEKIVKMLASMLHIGLDPPDSKSTFYQPVVFYCSSKTPFFLELFSRTMWLLSRTRREMKASTYADYPKVMHILQKQVRMALKTKPQDFKRLTEEMKSTSFQGVIENAQKEKEQEILNLIEDHPCVRDLKRQYMKKNELCVFQNRTNLLMEGDRFPKVLGKKAHGQIFVKLSKNLKDLQVYDVVDVKAPNASHKLIQTFNIEDITHVVLGKTCQHSTLCQNPEQAFSIVVEHEEKIKFIAEDEKTACYWADGLFLLMKHDRPKKLSKYYTEELDQLVVMDIRLQLLELQNVPIPKNPPPVPPLPANIKPEIAPKPKPRKFGRLK
ncbi:hypothetical protein HUJ04_009047 [Dendroctonus ponderosae]|nr:hypothetical protein HUJ04_009047 [Dendroctonus ponderosae]